MINVGYSDWKYDKIELGRKLDLLLPTIEYAASETDASCLIVSGTSGVWLGATLTMMQSLPVVLVRKDGENSHGSLVEGNTSAKRGLVVDDFISSGATINRIARTLGTRGMGLQVVGVIEHVRTKRTGWGEHFLLADPDFQESMGQQIRVFQADSGMLCGWKKAAPTTSPDTRMYGRRPKVGSYLDSIMF